MKPPSTDIAAEALVAVTGVFPEPLTRKDGEAAKKLPKAWVAKAKEFVEGEKFTRFKLQAQPDAEKTYVELIATVDADAATAGLADPQVAADYLDTLARARTHVRAMWPVVIRDAPTGPEWLDASTTAMGEAWAVLAVLDHPERVLDEMMMGTLTGDQADAFRDVYPRLYEMLAVELRTRLLAAGRKGYEMPWSRESVYRVFLGLSSGMEVTSQAPGPPPPKTKIQIDFKALQTRGQRLDAR